MRRLWVLLAVTLAFISVIVALELVASNSQPPGDVRSAAQQYVQYVNASQPASVSQQGSASVQGIVRAARRQAFTPAMSKASFADSAYYRTTYGRQDLASGRLAVSTLSGPRPIPYPPKELWCVQLSDGQIIFVAQHRDLYNADWILHEPVDGTESAQKVGCNL